MSLYFYHLDHLGTPRVITDADGNSVSKHKYLPFGEEMSPPDSTNTHEFTGHERDKETGLDYMLGRYYGPSMSRFLSVDPAQSSDMLLPQSWNYYSYSMNSPIGMLDPDGEAAKIFIQNMSSGKDYDKVNTSAIAAQVQEKFDKAGADAVVKAGAASPGDVQSGDVFINIEITSPEPNDPVPGSYGHGETKNTNSGHAHVDTQPQDDPDTAENELDNALANTVAHEAGHELGLGDNYKNTEEGGKADVMTTGQTKEEMAKKEHFNKEDSKKLQEASKTKDKK